MKRLKELIHEQLIKEADDLLGGDMGGDVGGGADMGGGADTAAPVGGGASDFGGGGGASSFGGGASDFGGGAAYGGGASDGTNNPNDKDAQRMKPDLAKKLDKNEIKFTIWQDTEKKVTKLRDNNSYQKIEYKYIDNKKKVKIDFLLGYVKKDKTWALWVGKIGACNYSDEPYCVLGTMEFNEAVILSLDKITTYVENVYAEPKKYADYFVNKE